MFGYLDFRTLMRCQRVGRGWREWIQRQGWVYEEMDFGERPVRAKTVMAYLPRAGGRVRRIVMGEVRGEVGRMMRAIVLRCQGLVEVVLPAEVVPMQVVDLAERLRALRVMKVGVVPRRVVGLVLEKAVGLEVLEVGEGGGREPGMGEDFVEGLTETHGLKTLRLNMGSGSFPSTSAVYPPTLYASEHTADMDYSSGLSSTSQTSGN